MTLVTDNFGANLNPTPKTFKVYKTLSATAVSGSAVTDTETFFSKDCPFNVDVIGFEVHSTSVVGSGFDGGGSNFTVALQSSDEVDASPAAPTTAAWDNVVSVNLSGVVSNTDTLLFKAPSQSGYVSTTGVAMDTTYVSVPKGGSLRTTLSVQAEDAVGVNGSTPVELLAIVECLPTNLKEQRYF